MHKSGRRMAAARTAVLAIAALGVASAPATARVFNGTGSGNKVTGTEKADKITLKGGNDRARGRGGADRISGGGGRIACRATPGATALPVVRATTA